MAGRAPGDTSTGGVAAVGFAALAIFCCAGLPLILALAASVGIGTVLGIAGGIVAATLLLGAVLIWAGRPRAACEPAQERDSGAAAPSPRGPRGHAVNARTSVWLAAGSRPPRFITD